MAIINVGGKTELKMLIAINDKLSDIISILRDKDYEMEETEWIKVLTEQAYTYCDESGIESHKELLGKQEYYRLKDKFIRLFGYDPTLKTESNEENE